MRRSDASEPFHRALDFYHWPQWRDTAGESRKVFSERLKNWVGKRYMRGDLNGRKTQKKKDHITSFIRGVISESVALGMRKRDSFAFPNSSRNE